jgi:NAD(P)-dependent dehydrogenase (short-subunit alcohol dehydrogenase family)
MKDRGIALITEAGNGLGKIFARLVLEQGYEVVLAAHGKSHEKLRNEGVDEAYTLVKTDLTSAESLEGLKDHLESTYGKLDLLINNAEIVNGFGHKIDQLDLEELKSVHEINFIAVLRIIKLMKPLLLRGQAPKIINITSSLGDLGKMKDETFCYSNYSLTAYATSKAALNLYTHLQAKEFKPTNIRIHSFDPVVMTNCTHNTVHINKEVLQMFLRLIDTE